MLSQARSPKRDLHARVLHAGDVAFNLLARAVVGLVVGADEELAGTGPIGAGVGGSAWAVRDSRQAAASNSGGLVRLFRGWDHRQLAALAQPLPQTSADRSGSSAL